MDIAAHLARRLSEKLGNPGHTPSGVPVWSCRLGGERAYATIEGGAPVSLRLMQAPDADTVDVCAVRLTACPTREIADAVIAELMPEPEH